MNYSEMCKTCNCDVCECLSQTNCPIEKAKAKKRSQIAKFVGHLVGGVLFRTPLIFALMLWAK